MGIYDPDEVADIPAAPAAPPQRYEVVTTGADARRACVPRPLRSRRCGGDGRGARPCHFRCNEGRAVEAAHEGAVRLDQAGVREEEALSSRRRPRASRPKTTDRRTSERGGG